MYRERRAPAGTIWTRTISAGAEELRILPDGCLDVIMMEGRLMVAGPDSVGRVTRGVAGAGFVGIRFDPGVGPAALGVPAVELRDRTVPLEDVWQPGRVRRLRDVLAASATPGLALASSFDGVRPDPWVPETVRWLRAGRAVHEIAGALGRSERQLHR